MAPKPGAKGARGGQQADSLEYRVHLRISSYRNFIIFARVLRNNLGSENPKKRLPRNPTPLPRILRISRILYNVFTVRQRNSEYFLFTGKLLKRMETSTADVRRGSQRQPYSYCRDTASRLSTVRVYDRKTVYISETLV